MKSGYNLQVCCITPILCDPVLQKILINANTWKDGATKQHLYRWIFYRDQHVQLVMGKNWSNESSWFDLLQPPSPLQVLRFPCGTPTSNMSDDLMIFTTHGFPLLKSQLFFNMLLLCWYIGTDANSSLRISRILDSKAPMPEFKVYFCETVRSAEGLLTKWKSSWNGRMLANSGTRGMWMIYIWCVCSDWGTCTYTVYQSSWCVKTKRRTK